MADLIQKEDLKKTLVEVFEPFAGAIREDFNHIDKRFDKIDKELTSIKSDAAVSKVNIQEGFKETRTELSKIKSRINETYNAVDGFIKVVDKLETEFTLIKEDLKRVKAVIKEKLGVDLL